MQLMFCICFDNYLCVFLSIVNFYNCLSFLLDIIRDTVTERLDIYTKLDIEAEQKIRAAIEAATQAMQPAVNNPKEGEEESETDDKDTKIHRIERRYGSFYRSIALPPGTKPDDVVAEADNGVITISLPKGEATKAKRVAVKAK